LFIKLILKIIKNILLENSPAVSPDEAGAGAPRPEGLQLNLKKCFKLL
jgi:hypothetical protein